MTASSRTHAHRSRRKRLVSAARAAVMAILVVPLWVAAEEPGGRPERDFQRNELALFLGGTWESGEDEPFFTVGLEYERRFSRRWGLSLAVEYLAEADAWVVVAPLTWRPLGNLVLSLGPGFQNKAPHEAAEGHGGHTAETGGRETFFLGRIGVGYDIELRERYRIVPRINVDFVRENGKWVEAVVFGVSLGIAF
jgi:hypothetical protein